MAKQLISDILQQISCLPDNWLIGCDRAEVVRIYEQKFHNLTQIANSETPPKILIAELEPMQFIASFIAACAAGCHVFLCNPNWVKQEWQQVFDLVNPDLVWGQAIEEEKSNYQSSISNSQLPITNSPLIMIPTGGSSGKIRFAIHTWETLMASVEGFKQYFQVSQINSFCVLPLYHVSGLMQFMRSFTTSGKLVILPFKAIESGNKGDINPEDFFISLVPTQLQRLLQNPDRASWLSRFHTVLLGGAPAWNSLLEAARRDRIQLAPTYGMTETASQIATLKPEDFLAGNNSYGQILPHAQVTISGTNQEILDNNQIGNITIKADSLALGYYPEMFANRRDNFQADDIGYFDEQGYLNIAGRSSDKIITGGENVFPAEVEATIRATGLVIDVCVIGLPDPSWGQVVTAIYVPLNYEVSTVSLQRAIKDKLSKFKRPKFWVSVASLPRNSQGKVNRELLQKIAISN